MSLSLDPRRVGQQLHTHDERLQHLEALVTELVKRAGHDPLYDRDVWGSLIGMASTMDRLTARIEALEKNNRLLSSSLLAVLAQGVTKKSPFTSAN